MYFALLALAHDFMGQSPPYLYDCYETYRDEQCLEVFICGRKALDILACELADSHVGLMQEIIRYIEVGRDKYKPRDSIPLDAVEHKAQDVKEMLSHYI